MSIRAYYEEDDSFTVAITLTPGEDISEIYSFLDAFLQVVPQEFCDNHEELEEEYLRILKPWYEWRAEMRQTADLRRTKERAEQAAERKAERAAKKAEGLASV